MGILLFFGGVTFLLFIPLYKGMFESLETSQNIPVVPPPKVINVASEAGEKIFDHGPIKIGENLLHQGPVKQEDLPQKIIIPSLSIDLVVKPAKVIGGTWEILEDAAAFGLGSTPPGEVGNTIIFAHAKKGQFSPLRNIKKDALVYILTPKTWYLYQVTEIKTVSPKQVEVLLPTDEETLTLYTCSGFADTKRLVVWAKRIPSE